MALEFRFPDLGEGIVEGELLNWKVAEGDVVAVDQTLAEMETDKAVVELPSPVAGKVVKLHAATGDIVKVGEPLVTLEEATAAASEAAAVAPEAAEPAAVPYTGSVVGRLEEAPEEGPAPVVQVRPPRPVAKEGPRVAEPVPAGVAEDGILAMPSVRALARELGVDLRGLRGTGPGGRILKQDVEDVAQAAAYGVAAAPVEVGVGAAAETGVGAVAETGVGAAAETGAGVEVETWAGVEAAPPTKETPAAPLVPVMGGVLGQDAHGLIERVPFRGVRRAMARRMSEAVAKQAQVTTIDEADVTIIKRIREKERNVAAERGVRLTYLAFVVKACTASLKRFPRLNAVLDESGEEFILKRYYNIGIAVDTKWGLMVPNIRDADQKSIFRIAEEIVDLVERAGQRTLDVSELHGGTFTITNYGAIGGLFATPVINYPEVAILGMGRVREVPSLKGDKLVNRLLLPLSLTFDHRLIDGAEAARFLNLVISYLEDPDLLLLEGA